MLAFSVLIGFLLCGLAVWFNIRAARNASRMPRREGSRYLVTRYFMRIAALLFILGAAIWYYGLEFGIGILASMFLGNFIILTVGRKQPFVRRLIEGQEKLN